MWATKYAIWMGHCLGKTPWGNSDLGVALGTTEVKTSKTSSILGQMGQAGSLLGSMQRKNIDGMVIW